MSDPLAEEWARGGRPPVSTAADRRWWAGARDGPLEAAWGPALLRLGADALRADAAWGVDGRPPSLLRPGVLEDLAEAVAARAYRPAALRRVVIRRGGRERGLGIATVADQAVMAAWRLWAEPRVEAARSAHVWGFRRGRSRDGAVGALVAGGPGDLVRTDIRRMFERLPHAELRVGVDRACGGPLSAWLVERWLQAWSPGVGVPTGVSVAPALADLVMGNRVDPCLVALRGARRLWAAVRWADDLALLVRGDAQGVLGEIAEAVRATGLELHPDKTRIHRWGCAGDWPARVLGVDLRPGALGLERL